MCFLMVLSVLVKSFRRLKLRELFAISILFGLHNAQDHFFSSS